MKEEHIKAIRLKTRDIEKQINELVAQIRDPAELVILAVCLSKSAKEISSKARIRAEKRIRYHQEQILEDAGLKEKAVNALLNGEKGVIGRRAKRQVLYIHPDDERLFWEGQGRRPKWLQEYIGNGGHLDDLLVDD